MFEEAMKFTMVSSAVDVMYASESLGLKVLRVLAQSRVRPME